MAEYTYADVIIDPEDPRVEIGKEYCFGDIPRILVKVANSNNNFWARLKRIDGSNFCFNKENGGWSSCLIRKKEPGQKYVPFDLSKEEDRAKLRGAWIKVKDGNYREYQIISLSSEIIYCGPTRDFGFSPISLLEAFEFIDGSPCGKLVEDDE